MKAQIKSSFGSHDSSDAFQIDRQAHGSENKDNAPESHRKLLLKCTIGLLIKHGKLSSLIHFANQEK